MKKFFIIVAAAVVAMAACSKVETVDNTPDTLINFTVVNHLQQTKATAGLTYPTSIPFGTFAWWTQDTWANTDDADKQKFIFMDNQEVNHSGGKWLPTTAYYWTKTGNITFASYSPYTASGDDQGYTTLPTYDVTDGFKFNNYIIVNSTDVDLMYANLAVDCTKNTNTDGSEVTDDSNPESGFAGVPTIFNHALCQIGFEFRAIGRKNPNVSDIKIVLNDVDILNIDNKGSFTQAASTKWATDHANNTADYDFAPASAIELSLLDGTNDAVVAATNNYTALGKTRILMPQALVVTKDNGTPVDATPTTVTDQKIQVNYTIKIKYNSSSEWATEDVTSIVRLNNGNIEAWLDNQNITYRISINPYSTIPVTFDPAIVDWTDVYSTDVNLNEFDD